MNRECNIARDLMPLCADSVANDDSREWMMAHINTCEDCAKVFADMQSKLPEPPPVEEDVSFSAAMRQLRKTVAWKWFNVLLGAFAALAIVVLIIIGYNWLFVRYTRPMSLNDYGLALFRTSSGKGLATVNYVSGFDGGLSMSFDDETHIMYIWMDSPIICTTSEALIKEPRYTSHVGFTWKNSIAVQSYGIMSGNEVVTPIAEIRKGTKADYYVLYRAGDNIPLCSEPLEEYLNLQNQIGSIITGTEDADIALQKHLTEYRENEIVPEWQTDPPENGANNLNGE